MKHERIEVTTTDGSAWLERLTPRQMIAIGDRIWSEQRKRLLQDMKDAEVDSTDRVQALRDHDDKRGKMSEILNHCVNMRGSLEIIEVASNGKNSENADGLPDNFVGSSEDAMYIALALVAAEIEITPEKTKSKKK